MNAGGWCGPEDFEKFDLGSAVVLATQKLEGKVRSKKNREVNRSLIRGAICFVDFQNETNAKMFAFGFAFHVHLYIDKMTRGLVDLKNDAQGLR